MILYHRTPHGEKIIAEGFRDRTGTYFTIHEFTGVWFSDRPLNSSEGAKGSDLLRIEMPESKIKKYEWIEEGRPYREFLIPAAVVNKLGPPHLCTAEEEDAAFLADDRFHEEPEKPQRGRPLKAGAVEPPKKIKGKK